MASALVQMTAFSPCSQLGDMIMMGMEASLESFPGSREDGNKRSHSDGDEDQDRNYVKKRRKQSKPIRITANDLVSDNKPHFHPSNQGISVLDFSETGEHFLSEGLPQGNAESIPTADNYEDLNQVNKEPKNKFEDNQEKIMQPEKMYEPILPLNLSSIKPTSMDSLIVPNVSEGQTTANKQVPTEKDPNQPFQPMSQDSVKTSIAQEGSYLPQSPSLLLPLIRQNQIQNQITQGSSQMRIFNPEAFCDLCNKEFCNKYFLKTHKANKHGIYTENASGPTLIDPLLSLPFTNYFSTSNESFENTPTFQASKNLFSQNNYSANRTVLKKTQGTQPQQTSLFSLKSTSSGNMRALCNICQREFCNKYFVRRHKLKIHGIVEPVSKDDSTPNMHEYSIGNNSSQDKPDVPTTEIELYNSNYNKQFPSSNFNSEKQELPLKIELNTEKPKEKLEKEPDGELQVPIPTSSDAISFFHLPQNEENNKENSLSSIRLKKLGVVNADAFCDICCKEYCNKYFLRTHKLKSHGIVPVEDKKDDSLNGTTGNNFWYQNQAAPLNLIVNESLTNKDTSNKINFDVDGEECVCGICGRYFQSQYLLKMHQAYTHPNKYHTNEAVVTAKQNLLTFEKNSTESENHQTPFSENYSLDIKSEFVKDADESDNKQVVNPENVHKLQALISRLNNPNTSESSFCDVCEKDVGHVSLLENHILKEHALLLEEMGNITEEENSSSQGSLIGSVYNFKKDCPHCQKAFYKRSELEQHIREAHCDLEQPSDLQTNNGPTEFNDTNSCTKLVPFVSQPSEERPGIQTPTSSFCEICKKELCNKYFMKTHMQRMHGISIENGSQIGGVVCDICNKELCSKYFLRVHKQNSHGIVDELFLPQLGMDFISNSSPNSDLALKPMDQADLTHRYFSHFTEVCTICSRRFRSVKWLKAHLWNDHGEEGKEKWKEVFLPACSDPKGNQFECAGKNLEFPVMFGNSSNQSNNIFSSNSGGEINQNGKDTPERQGLVDKNLLNNTMFSMIMNGKDSESKHYQCSYCSFSTTILAFLFIHERTHMNNRSFQSEGDQQLQCPVCFQNSNSKESFDKHMKLHKMAWQQPFQSNASSLELQKGQGDQTEVNSDFTNPQDRVTRQEQEPSGSSSTLFPNESKSTSLPNSQTEQVADSSLHCQRCGFKTGSVQLYLDHMTRDHPFQQMDQDLPSHLQLVERVLSNLAANAGIPAVVALPQVQEHVTMQPFVLEDSEYVSDLDSSIDPKSGKTFLSSLVFLPVKEKLKKSVTASFKLTPT